MSPAGPSPSGRGVVGIVGLGLIGGSVARALDAAGATVVATSRSAGTRAAATAVGLHVVDDVARVVAIADVVVLATPLPAAAGVVEEVAGALPSEGPVPTITDVGSVKAPIARSAAQVLDDASIFVGGHPMAGTEHAGFAHSDSHLFDGAQWALAVDEPTDLARWVTVARMALAVGAQVVPVCADEHDEVVALTSHLPYVLAAELAATAATHPRAALVRSLAAGSFRDATRVAGGHPSLGAEMAAANAAALAAPIAALVAAVEAHAGGTDEAGAARFAAGHEAQAWLTAPAAGVTVPVELDREILAALGRRGGRITGIDVDGRGELRLTAWDPGAGNSP